ncbi:hypothetical protein QAD02_009710 [Eretmocerus hayati]|uniref:Uncharacterized protein n=1 Tax=Eretmocerus hayati TaxID=131215 RepID=A0ACC2NAF7_9HYME|nr:hypothetical protein QAD02_009710 [Eretmocerus hayati]
MCLLGGVVVNIVTISSSANLPRRHYLVNPGSTPSAHLRRGELPDPGIDFSPVCQGRRLPSPEVSSLTPSPEVSPLTPSREVSSWTPSPEVSSLVQERESSAPGRLKHLGGCSIVRQESPQKPPPNAIQWRWTPSSLDLLNCRPSLASSMPTLDNHPSAIIESSEDGNMKVDLMYPNTTFQKSFRDQSYGFNATGKDCKKMLQSKENEEGAGSILQMNDDDSEIIAPAQRSFNKLSSEKRIFQEESWDLERVDDNEVAQWIGNGGKTGQPDDDSEMIALARRSFNESLPEENIFQEEESSDLERVDDNEVAQSIENCEKTVQPDNDSEIIAPAQRSFNELSAEENTFQEESMDLGRVSKIANILWICRVVKNFI